MTAANSRTYSWLDLGLAARDLAGLSGLDFCLRVIERGWQLPIWSTLDMHMKRAARGTATMELTPQPFHANPGGVVHGGVISTALDSAASAAVHTTLAAGDYYSTIDLAVHFTRPVKLDGSPLEAVGQVVNEGRELVLAEAAMRSAESKLLAHAVVSLRVVRA